MIFSSLLFIFGFFPFAMLIYFLSATFCKRIVVLNFLLCLFSIAFYYWGSGSAVVIIVFSVVFNWLLGQRIAASRSAATQKWIVACGVVTNIGIIFYFKYMKFFLDSFSYFFNLPPFDPNIAPNLPVGISFYTFMSISYLVDKYRAEHSKCSFLEYFTYLTLYPHLVAGPIVRHSELSADLKSRRIDLDKLYEGAIRFSIGLGKKVLLADTLARTVDPIFAMPTGELTLGLAWLAAVCYTFQIYFDFSGYTDMAIGLAFMLGFKFPENFNLPYQAQSMTEFWKRWHMSLSRWLRDYLYFPLGGNRKGVARTLLNLLIVFTLCGLWHGASWTFVVWGLFHGAVLVVERVLDKKFDIRPSGVFGVLLTFFLATLGWVLFRSTSFAQALSFFGAMLTTVKDFSLTAFPQGRLREFLNIELVYTLILAAFFSFFPERWRVLICSNQQRLRIFVEVVMASVLLTLASSSLALNTFSPFIYFRF